MSKEGVAKFYKVDLERYQNDYQGTFQSKGENEATFTDGIVGIDVKKIYDDIKLPKRATKCSAGYDFYSPIDFTIESGETIKIPTGIRCKMDADIVLMIYPRSSLGFKYRMMLENTVGVIDSDYFDADNQGHIFIKFTNHGNKKLSVKKGEAFAQGIFTKYFVTIDDETYDVRKGGIGSTNDVDKK